MLSGPGGASEELAGWKVLDDSTNKVRHETNFFEIIELKNLSGYPESSSDKNSEIGSRSNLI